jgi:hypothetical protein
MAQELQMYDRAAGETVELGNRLSEEGEEVDLWEIADGILAGAIQYWLFSRQPCGEPGCPDCEGLSTAEKRLAELMELVRGTASESDYFHTALDTNVGRA